MGDDDSSFISKQSSFLDSSELYFTSSLSDRGDSNGLHDFDVYCTKVVLRLHHTFMNILSETAGLLPTFTKRDEAMSIGTGVPHQSRRFDLISAILHRYWRYA